MLFAVKPTMNRAQNPLSKTTPGGYSQQTLVTSDVTMTNIFPILMPILQHIKKEKSTFEMYLQYICTNFIQFVIRGLRKNKI